MSLEACPPAQASSYVGHGIPAVGLNVMLNSLPSRYHIRGRPNLGGLGKSRLFFLVGPAIYNIKF